MKRKVVLQGNATLMVSLPSRWCKKHHVVKGDEVDIIESDSSLVLSRDGDYHQKELSVNLDTKDLVTIRSIIASGYRRGYSKLVLNSKNHISFVQINKVVDSLIGFVITDHGENRIIIENVMDPKFEGVDSALKKYFQTLNFFIGEVVENFKTNSRVQSELLELYYSIRKQRDYCQRLVHVSNFHGDKSFEYYTLIFLVDKIASVLMLNLGRKFTKQARLIVVKELTEVCYKLLELQQNLAKKKVSEVIKLNKVLRSYEDDLYNENKLPGFILVVAAHMYGLSSRVVGVLI